MVGTSACELCNKISHRVVDEAIIATGEEAGWPTTIDWKLVPRRVFDLQDELKEIFYKPEALVSSMFWLALHAVDFWKKPKSVSMKDKVTEAS